MVYVRLLFFRDDIYICIYQLSPKTRKSNVFSKNVRFCYWCWNSSACWIWCENLFRHAFLGFLWRSEAGNGSTWDACRVFWHLFLVCLLRNLPSIASCNQPFLFGTVLVFLWGWFFSELVFLQWGDTPAALARQFLNGAGAVAGAGIIQFKMCFFQNVRTQDVSKTILPLLGWNCAWQLEPLDPEKFKNKAGEIPHPD